MAGGKGPTQNIGGDSSFTTTPLATMGDRGSAQLKPTPEANRTHWKAGTSVEVAWGIRYNHGGGYQCKCTHAIPTAGLLSRETTCRLLACSDRLCPAGQPLTEDCMQKMVRESCYLLLAACRFRMAT